ETTTDFIAPLPWHDAEEICRHIHREITQLECKTNLAVSAMYGCEGGNAPAETSRGFDRVEVARRLVSHEMRKLVSNSKQPVLLDSIARKIRERLPHAGEIDTALDGIERFIVRDFATWHTCRYQRRPVLWIFGRGGKRYVVAHDRATAEVVRWIARALKDSVP